MDKMQELQKWLDFNKSITDVFDSSPLPQPHPHPSILLTQGRKELKEFSSIIEKMDSKKIALEIGIYYGGTFFFWNLFFDKVIGIDINSKCCEFIIRRLKDFGYDITKHLAICGSSFDINTVEKVKDELKDNKIDMLFIDGLHSYEAMLKDFLFYSPLVKSGGIIGFHDVGEETHPHELQPGFINLHRCATHIIQEHKKYNVTKMKFIHTDFSGIGWCIKE